MIDVVYWMASGAMQAVLRRQGTLARVDGKVELSYPEANVSGTGPQAS